ncbi:DUF485 domain-containing protein [Specibacter sp. RAF43]|uniref:DUF485 domain-containing protein n=1 Tax=Specibacter sp. RAF43 TaxID=3233057 RepID=UPI003F95009B
MGNSAQASQEGSAVDFVEVQASEEFADLRKTHRSFVFPVAIGFLLWYFAYVLLADYAHEFMSTKVWGSINIGLILGLLQFLSTFGITTWYVSYANRKLDPKAAKIRTRLESQIADANLSKEEV